MRMIKMLNADPRDMKAAADPVGSDNNEWLQRLSNDAGMVVATWGNDGSFLGRSKQVKELLPNLHCLKLNKSGEPAHPLYQKADIDPVPMSI